MLRWFLVALIAQQKMAKRLRRSTSVVSLLQMRIVNLLLSTGVHLLPNRSIALLVVSQWVCCAVVTSLLSPRVSWHWKMSSLAKVILASVTTKVWVAMILVKVCADTARCLPCWARAALVNSVTSLQRFSQSKTKSFAHRKVEY